MKVTLITGASAGIGEAVAHQFAAKKHNVVLVARNEVKLKTLCIELANQYKIEATYIVADLSKSESAQQVYNECSKRNLMVNVLINNAGIGSSGEFYKNDLASEISMLQLNNSSLVAMCHLFVQNMIKAKSGYIINVASLAAFIPSPYMAVYAASKAFVRSFTEAFTEELKPYNVQVMLFNPGLTESNFMDSPANNNEWGKIVVKGNGIKTQTCEQVAIEMSEAFDNKKSFHISGSRNRFNIKMSALIPNATIARMFGKQKREQMGL